MISSRNRRCSPPPRALGAAAAASRVAPLRADAATVRSSAQSAQGARSRGNYSRRAPAAPTRRSRARSRRLPTAHLAAARAALAEGDGISAEAELEQGARRRLRHDAPRANLLAHARLLQGDARGALADGEDRRCRRSQLWPCASRRARSPRMGNPAAAQDVFDAAIAHAPDDSAAVVRHRAASACDDRRSGRRDRGGERRGRARRATISTRCCCARNWSARNMAWPRRCRGTKAALKRDPYSYDVLIDYAATLGDAGRAADMLAATRRALAVAAGQRAGVLSAGGAGGARGQHRSARASMLRERRRRPRGRCPARCCSARRSTSRTGDYEQAVGEAAQPGRDPADEHPRAPAARRWRCCGSTPRATRSTCCGRWRCATMPTATR